MKRREFIAGIGGAAAWPLVARAQQVGLTRRIGMLAINAENDPQVKLRTASFHQSLATLGWVEKQNLHTDYRYSAGELERLRVFASELVGLRPDVLLVDSTPALEALRQATRVIPIVFTTVADPIGGGFVSSLKRPGGNITGFMSQEPPLAGKWVQLLKQVAPGLRRAAFPFNPQVAPYAGEFFRHAESAAAPLMVEMTAAAVRDDSEIEEALAALGREPDGGFVVDGDGFTTSHRARTVAVAARHRLPAIYPFRIHAVEGGLISYGVDFIDQFRQAASYVDRILRGDKPADLPIQAATKYELVINLKTAKAMGLHISSDMVSIADEVIE
jgi:putative ABC transport system substrate-binding protein